MGLRTGAGLVGLIGLEREIADILARNVDVVPVAILKAGPAFQALAESIPL